MLITGFCRNKVGGFVSENRSEERKSEGNRKKENDEKAKEQSP